MIPVPVSPNRPLVIFSDLDGTLLDHHTYDAQGSEAAIRALARRPATLVFCSSKTFSEQLYLQRQLRLCLPFIFENGSAVAIPSRFFPEKRYTAQRQEEGYDIVVFAHTDAAALRSVLAGIPGLLGFDRASDAELSTATGLNGDALMRARARWFTETLLRPSDPSQARQIGSLLEPEGFSLSRGGRFYTAQSAAVSKGKAVQWMMALLGQAAGEVPCFAAVGDSANDISMLEVVDLPFLVQGPDRSWAAVPVPQLRRVTGVGPAGFSEVVRMLLDE
ncbi:MAG: HAD-IIB family hydrolase [Saprospiraceae bacterium]|nr:HAD-IIB family hydrolase [Saprospiraceae bacterium]